MQVKIVNHLEKYISVFGQALTKSVRQYPFINKLQLSYRSILPVDEPCFNKNMKDTDNLNNAHMRVKDTVSLQFLGQQCFTRTCWSK